jgi:hypothetical protein
MEATSALLRLPINVMIPATTQQASTNPGEPKPNDMPEIFLNTPDPIMELMTRKATPHMVMERSKPNPDDFGIAIASSLVGGKIEWKIENG